MTEWQVKRRLRFASFDGYRKVMGKFSVYCMPMKKVMQLWFTRLPTIKDTGSPDIAVGEDQVNEEYCEKTSASNKCLAGSAATLAVSDSEDDKLGPLTSCGGGEKPGSDFGGDRRPKEPVSACALLHSIPINSEDEEVCVVHRPVEENHECQIGGMVFSSTCCVVLVIFALLFVLIGSVLAFIVYHRVDVKLIKFLTNYNYLKVASPLMICLGLVMLIFGTVFWIAKRKRKARSADYMNQSPAHLHPDSYFSPTDISPTPRSSTAARGRGSSVCSGSSHLESVGQLDTIVLGIYEPRRVTFDHGQQPGDQQQVDATPAAQLLVCVTEPITCSPGVRDITGSSTENVEGCRCEEDASDHR